MTDIQQDGLSQRSAPQRRHMAHLRRHSCCEPRKSSSWDGGGDNMYRAIWGECAPKHLVTWAAWTWEGHKTQHNWVCALWSAQEPEPERLRPGKCTQPRAHLRQFTSRATWSLSSVDGESTRSVWAGETQCGPDTASAPHTRQGCLSAGLLPPHSTTEEVSLKMWSPSPLCVRAEIRHWRDLQTEEAKINEEVGTALEVTGATD